MSAQKKIASLLMDARAGAKIKGVNSAHAQASEDR